MDAYMQPSAKAMKQGKSLMDSGHLHSVKFHHISTNLQYCFIHSCCVPEEKTSSDSYYHLRSTVKRERFFRACLFFKGDSFPDNCINWTNENVSFGARNHECLLSKRTTFCSRGEQV